MSKFSGRNATVAQPKGPTATTGVQGPTHEYGRGYEKDAKTALFTLGLTNMVGEPTFYEAGSTRDKRFVDLIDQVAKEDPTWLMGYIPWLRRSANMRSASVVAAAEVVRALVGTEHGINLRRLVNNACQRADEPGEMLGYWQANYGKKLPMPLKRGLGDAALRLYNEYAILKYDTPNHGVRFADVIELCHPAESSGLFRHVIDRRHKRFERVPEEATKLSTAYRLETIPKAERRALLRAEGSQLFREAGFTWERLSGWLPDGMDAEAWEAILPNMGHMALIRNIRNIEAARVSKETIAMVAAKIADPQAVAKGRQFPYRYWSAWKNSGTIQFGPALEAALDYSLENVPAFEGRSLVLIDTSASMRSAVSAKSKVQCFEIGALFGTAVASKSDCDLVLYASQWMDQPISHSVLRTIQEVERNIGKVGHATNLWPAVHGKIARSGKQYDRILIFDDGQVHPSHLDASQLPKSTPIYAWDLRGHQRTSMELGSGRYLLGGFSDAAFKVVPLLERGSDAPWPWELQDEPETSEDE